MGKTTSSSHSMTLQKPALVGVWAESRNLKMTPYRQTWVLFYVRVLLRWLSMKTTCRLCYKDDSNILWPGGIGYTQERYSAGTYWIIYAEETSARCWPESIPHKRDKPFSISENISDFITFLKTILNFIIASLSLLSLLSFYFLLFKLENSHFCILFLMHHC